LLSDLFPEQGQNWCKIRKEVVGEIIAGIGQCER
jgi:hypothetical protein